MMTTRGAPNTNVDHPIEMRMLVTAIRISDAPFAG
jgi:hypothetical protein